LDRSPVPVRAQRGRLLRNHARRLGLGLEVLLPGGHARGRPADLLRGLPGARAARGDLHRADAVAHGDRARPGGDVVPGAAAGGVPRVPRRRLRRDQPRAVRPDRGRRRARRRLQHRVRRRPLRLLLLRGVPERARRLGGRGHGVPRRLADAVRHPPARVGGPDRGAREDGPGHVPVHLGAGDASPPALRPADELRLEGAAAAGDAQRARNGDRGRGGRLIGPPAAPGPRRGGPPATLTVTTGSPPGDVVEVQRSPAPGPARGAWRSLRETARGLKTTFARIREGPTTIQYPEEKVPVYPRFRGRHKLHRFEDTGLEKCVGCSLCAAACPADCIRVVAAENTPENRVSAGERYAAVYEVHLSRCLFRGYCEVACPFDAITMGHDYELSDYDRTDLIFTKEMLLAEPVERTPLRNEGE